MAEQEYKTYDDPSRWHYPGARLTANPEVRNGANGKMVRFDVVSTSYRKNNPESGVIDLWIEVNVSDFQAEAASFLQKGDRLVELYGHLYARQWGEPKKVSICMDKARLEIDADLMKKLKERGFVLGKQGQAKKPTTAKKPKREIQNLPED